MGREARPAPARVSGQAVGLGVPAAPSRAGRSLGKARRPYSDLLGCPPQLYNLLPQPGGRGRWTDRTDGQTRWGGGQEGGEGRGGPSRDGEPPTRTHRHELVCGEGPARSVLRVGARTQESRPPAPSSQGTQESRPQAPSSPRNPSLEVVLSFPKNSVVQDWSLLPRNPEVQAPASSLRLRDSNPRPPPLETQKSKPQSPSHQKSRGLCHRPFLPREPRIPECSPLLPKEPMITGLSPLPQTRVSCQPPHSQTWGFRSSLLPQTPGSSRVLPSWRRHSLRGDLASWMPEGGKLTCHLLSFPVRLHRLPARAEGQGRPRGVESPSFPSRFLCVLLPSFSSLLLASGHLE